MQSGNCWLFAPVVLARSAALRSGRIPATESLSETYLYFFDLLEKANSTLHDLGRIAERKHSLDADTLRQGLSREVMGLDDGGEWEWAFNLIEKYGLVPAHLMPETASAKTGRFASGFQGVAWPLAASRAAIRLRTAPPISVNCPPA